MIISEVETGFLVCFGVHFTAVGKDCSGRRMKCMVAACYFARSLLDCNLGD